MANPYSIEPFDPDAILPPPKAILSDWYSKVWWQKLLLPGDFLEHSEPRDVERFSCVRSTTDYLTLNESESFKTLKIRKTVGYRTDLDYEPEEFKNETVRFIDLDRQEIVTCRQCRGRGEVPCYECRGQGEVNCPECHGRRNVAQNCRDCGGSGYRFADTRCHSCRGRGNQTVDCTRCPGDRIYGPTGKVGCPRCGSTGLVSCRACDAEGIGVRARILTKKFAHKVNILYEVPGLQKNQFKNDLQARDFNKVRGKILTHDEYMRPESADTIRQKLTVETFDVHAAKLTYKGKPFVVNLIIGEGHKYIARRLPLSKRKMLIAAGVGSGVGIIAVAALSLITLL